MSLFDQQPISSPVRSVPYHRPETQKSCLNLVCRHGASWHSHSTLGRRGRCEHPGCWCRKYQKALPDDGEWKENLERLRATGKRRGQQGNPSRSLLPLLHELPDGAVMVDVGCGDSGDRIIAEQLGLVAYGVDLFPPFQRTLHPGFVCADALQLPFVSQSVDGIVFHAVTSLIKPDDRRTLYAEMARVLKPNGLLSMTLYWLADGYQVSSTEEDGRVLLHGFRRINAGRVYRRFE